MKIKSLLTVVVAILFVTCSFSYAAQKNSNNGTSKTKKQLKGDGYSCKTVSLGFVECTKSGKNTYWCTGKTCTVKPFKHPRSNRNPRYKQPTPGPLVASPDK